MTINGKEVNILELLGFSSVLVTATLSIGVLYADQATMKDNIKKMQVKIDRQANNVIDIKYMKAQQREQTATLERIERLLYKPVNLRGSAK